MITAEKLLAQIRAMDAEAIQDGKIMTSQLSDEVYAAIDACPTLAGMFAVMELCATSKIIFSMGIQVGYKLAQAERMNEELGG